MPHLDRYVGGNGHNDSMVAFRGGVDIVNIGTVDALSAATCAGPVINGITAMGVGGF